MPRLKVCRTKALIREANRIKSARHYHKHRESILASKKAAREKLRQEEEIERQVPDILLKTRTKRTFRIKANKKRRQERFQTDQAEMGRLATDYFDPASRLQRLKNGLMQVTGSCPSGYIENLFNLYMQLRESGTKRKNTPLSDAQVMFDTMLSSIYRFTQEILNMNGLNADFKRAEAFAGQVRTLIRCLDDIEMAILDPDMDPLKAYKAKELLFQDAMIRDCIDGKCRVGGEDEEAEGVNHG